LHGRFGVGSMTFADGFLSTLGRDGVIHNLKFDGVAGHVRKCGATRLKFSWLERLLQFRGKIFVLVPML
jgi:hypothetical protein